jgi:hypothetical protein
MNPRASKFVSAFALLTLLLPALRLSRASVPSSAVGSVSQIHPMHIARASHSATLLPNGKVLIAGGFSGSGGEAHPYSSTELFDPRTGTFEAGPSMAIGRSSHSAVTLKSGKVLIVGGWTGRDGARNSAELYDPATNTFIRTGNLVVERAGSMAALLPDGRVLVVGGVDRDENALASAEIYDPATERFALTGSLSEARGQHTVTALRNGKVLVVGGGSGHYPAQGIHREAELFDPATGKFSPAGATTVPRHKHAAILLNSGRVLIVGGSDNHDWHGEYASAETYDPQTSTFTATGPMHTARFKLPQAIALLSDGRVLVAGGGPYAEVFDERTNAFIQIPGSLETAHWFESVIALSNGRALITGGYFEQSEGLPATASAWLYR